MKTIEVHRIIQRLDELFKKIKQLDLDDTEIQSHWAKYLCVLVSGLLEESVRVIISKYAENKSKKDIANYIEKQLSSFQNAKMGKILNLLALFNQTWKSSLEKIVDGELKDAVDSVVSNRHLIAHGKSIGLTYTTINEYYLNVKKVIEEIEKIVLG